MEDECPSKLHGQCYDGTAVMRGAQSGIAKQILDLEQRAVILLVLLQVML